jgi:hypothetical protein
VEVLGDVGLAVAGEATSRNDASALDEAEARSISHWFPYDRVRVVNAVP